jgi:hypothetical protein
VSVEAAATEVRLEVRAGRFEAGSFEALRDRAEAFDGQVVVTPPPEPVVRVCLPRPVTPRP